MTLRRALLVSAAAAAAIAAWCWWPTATVRAPSVGTSEPAAGRPPANVEIVRSDADATRQPARREPVESGAARRRSLTVTVDPGAYELPADLRVELRFGNGELLRRQPLRVGPDGVATWTAGERGVWPQRVGFAFPTRERNTAPVGDRSQVVLPLPATCRLAFEVLDVDGLPASDADLALVSTPWASGDRGPRRVELVQGRGELLVEAGGERVDVEVLTSASRRARATFWASRRAGERVACRVPLGAEGGVAFQVHQLPEQGGPWRIEVFLDGGSGVVRAPRYGDGYLAFVAQIPGDPVGAFLDEGCFVVARGAAVSRWGPMRDRVAQLQPMVEVAAGRVVDAAGKGLEGLWVELWPARERPPRGVRIAATRTARDGSFVVLGPDPEQVPTELYLPATRKRIELPQQGPLLLRASH